MGRTLSGKYLLRKEKSRPKAALNFNPNFLDQAAINGVDLRR
jgi:hypothetical protein